MLFEVFRCEETDSIDSIAIAHFLKVGLVKGMLFLLLLLLLPLLLQILMHHKLLSCFHSENENARLFVILFFKKN